MIVSNKEIHNVIDLAHTGPGTLASTGLLPPEYAASRVDAAPRVDSHWTDRAPSRPLHALRSANSESVSPGMPFEPPPYRAYQPAPLPALPGQDRRWRHTRVHDLRRQLADGRYSVVPDQVADKIIGRALCDQVSRLYDR